MSRFNFGGVETAATRQYVEFYGPGSVQNNSEVDPLVAAFFGPEIAPNLRPAVDETLRQETALSGLAGVVLLQELFRQADTEQWAAIQLRQLFGEPQEELFGAREVAVGLLDQEFNAREQFLELVIYMYQVYQVMTKLLQQFQLDLLRQIEAEEIKRDQSRAIAARLDVTSLHVGAQESGTRLKGDTTDAADQANTRAKELAVALAQISERLNSLELNLGTVLETLLATPMRAAALNTAVAIPVGTIVETQAAPAGM